MVTTPEQLAASLVRRHRRSMDLAHARAVDIRQRVEKTLLTAGRAGRFRRAFLIGSLASGKFGKASDIDVVTEGLAPDDLGLLYGELLSASGVAVDLLRLEELSPSFRERVEHEGILLYGS